MAVGSRQFYPQLQRHQSSLAITVWLPSRKPLLFRPMFTRLMTKNWILGRTLDQDRLFHDARQEKQALVPRGAFVWKTDALALAIVATTRQDNPFLGA
ncbi:hypothetical protein PV08_04616 [Exophiala spinifera]|uniref:Uncharacterized protein n=1 Tax=Exophiala spinifera TaxID=91928 RepID=A0A0D1ZXN5_9EURO|nr:uncharacterized protein PV08_04616 [Exophiala spinifera]KIW17422.1 hypothetical protein PV08_04616 [Exophiala spinifera]